MKEKLSHTQRSIIEAALRPEFQSPHFNPDDYELSDGYPVRKDRFKSICQNAASSLYGGSKWSAQALRRHLQTLLNWWSQFAPAQKFTQKRIVTFEYKSKQYQLELHDWLQLYLYDSDLFSVEKVSRDQEDVRFDVILSDGSVLTQCQCAFAPLKLSKEFPGVLEMPSAPQLSWNGVNVTGYVVAYRESQSSKKQPFWCRFSKENLRADLQTQLSYEQSLQNHEAENIRFLVEDQHVESETSVA